MTYTGNVRCGNLASVSQDVASMNPESLAGLCGQTGSPEKRPARLPSQGPAPLSTWGFSLGEVVLMMRLRRSSARAMLSLQGQSFLSGRDCQGHGESGTRKPVLRPPHLQNIFPDRSPRVSSAPEWEARKKTTDSPTRKALSVAGATPMSYAGWFDSGTLGSVRSCKSRHCDSGTHHFLLSSGVGGGFAWNSP